MEGLNFVWKNVVKSLKIMSGHVPVSIIGLLDNLNCLKYIESNNYK